MSRPHKTEPQKTRKKDQRDNPWCSIEIKRAIQQRRVYNRAKRNAKTPEEKQKYGALYIEQKHLVQGMVKEGIQSYEQWTLNRDLGSEHNPRYRPWEYVTRRERRRRRRENSQEVVEEREGRQYPPDATDISDDRFNPTHAETQSEFPVANNDTMAFMSLNDYLQRVQGTLYDQNGDALAFPRRAAPHPRSTPPPGPSSARYPPSRGAVPPRPDGPSTSGHRNAASRPVYNGGGARHTSPSAWRRTGEHNQGPGPDYRHTISTNTHPTLPSSPHAGANQGCYNCGEFNHHEYNCKFDHRLKCGFCHRFGHKLRFCPDYGP